MAQSLKITADDLLLACLTNSIIITDTETHHVYSHIGRRLIRTLTVNRGKERLQYRVDLHVTVIVYSRLAVRLQMEGVDHVHILQIRRSGFVGYVERMFERQVPYRKSLELRISGFVSANLLVVQLRETHRHLTASGSRGCDNHQRLRRLNILIATKTLFARNQIHIVRITINDIVVIDADAFTLQTLTVRVRRTLSRVVGNNDRRHHKPTAHKLFAQTKHILIIGNTQILTHLIALNIIGRNDDNNLQRIAQLGQHTQFAVGHKTRQHTTCMHIVKQLAT